MTSLKASPQAPLILKESKSSGTCTSTKATPERNKVTHHFHMSRLVGKPTMWFPTRSDTNRPVLSQKRARSLKVQIYVEEELYYLYSENKGADQLRSYLRS